MTLTDCIVKIKESEKINQYLDLAGELKKTLWNMRVRVTPIVVDTLGKNTKRIGNQRKILFDLSYLPTPPLGQDMTQSQFLSGV